MLRNHFSSVVFFFLAFVCGAFLVMFYTRTLPYTERQAMNATITSIEEQSVTRYQGHHAFESKLWIIQLEELPEEHLVIEAVSGITGLADLRVGDRVYFERRKLGFLGWVVLALDRLETEQANQSESTNQGD